MNEVVQSSETRQMSRILWIGLTLLCVGTGPLVIFIIAAQLGLTSDPNPNPIGLGLLAFFTFWPAVILTTIGIVSTVRKRRAIRQA